MWNEAVFARRRIHGQMATEAVLMQSVIVTAIGGGDTFKKTLERLDDE